VRVSGGVGDGLALRKRLGSRQESPGRPPNPPGQGPATPTLPHTHPNPWGKGRVVAAGGRSHHHSPFPPRVKTLVLDIMRPRRVQEGEGRGLGKGKKGGEYRWKSRLIGGGYIYCFFLFVWMYTHHPSEYAH